MTLGRTHGIGPFDSFGEGFVDGKILVAVDADGEVMTMAKIDPDDKVVWVRGGTSDSIGIEQTLYAIAVFSVLFSKVYKILQDGHLLCF